jgi:hypothetical protein
MAIGDTSLKSGTEIFFIPQKKTENFLCQKKLGEIIEYILKKNSIKLFFDRISVYYVKF